MTAKGKINNGKEKVKYTILTMVPGNESVSLTSTSVFSFLTALCTANMLKATQNVICF